jgi:hypothetical protein
VRIFRSPMPAIPTRSLLAVCLVTTQTGSGPRGAQARALQSGRPADIGGGSLPLALLRAYATGSLRTICILGLFFVNDREVLRGNGGPLGAVKSNHE